MLRSLKGRVLSALVLGLVLAFIGTADAQTGAPKGTLHVLAVGISQYVRPGNDLQWADQDAIDHVNFWRTQEGRLFQRVLTKSLLNRQATRANILQAMEEIGQQAQSGDTVVAPFSGHGYDPKYTNGIWQFAAADQPISAKELEAWVVKLTQKGVRVILVLDACHSGAANIYVDGAIVLTACLAHEGTPDGDPIALKGNGVFTEILLEALRGQADLNGDGIITLDEVVSYVSRQMPGRSGGRQPKAFHTGSTPNNVGLAQIHGGAPQGEPAPGPATHPPAKPPVPPVTGPLGSAW